MATAVSLPTSNTTVPVSLTMPHATYAEAWNRWSLMRDILEGEDVIKERGTTYLPQPNGMTSDEYSAYKERASFIGYVARALDAMLGLVGRRKAALVCPEDVESLRADVTLTGVSLDSFALSCMAENLSVGRVGILVDYPVTPEEPMVLSDVEAAGLRPYFVLYKAEDILDWRESRVGNRRVLTYLKLQETFEEPFDETQQGAYLTRESTRVRLLKLTSQGCRYEVYSINEMNDGSGKTKEVLEAAGTIYRAGKPLMYIPFFPVGPMKNTMAVQRPPLLDAAFINIHHYQASADRNHAVHWADVPTPVLIGQLQSKDGQPVSSIKLGPTSAINLSEGGDAKFLEMLGHGITPTKELMNEYVEALSVMANKIMATDTRSAEAAETAAIHRSGEQAILATMANNVSMAITSALRCAADFMEIPFDEEVTFRLPTDYLPGTLDSQTFIALIGALQNREISPEEFFEALIAGEVIRPDKTYAQHKEEIDRAKKDYVPTPPNKNTTASSSGIITTPEPVTDTEDTDGKEDDAT